MQAQGVWHARVLWSLMLSYVRFLKVPPTIFVGEMTELALEIVSFLSYLLMLMQCQIGSQIEVSDNVSMSKVNVFKFNSFLMPT